MGGRCTPGTFTCRTLSLRPTKRPLNPPQRGHYGKSGHAPKTSSWRSLATVTCRFPVCVSLPCGQPFLRFVEPIVPQYFHQDEVMGQTPDFLHRNKPAFLETSLGPVVPLQGMQVDSLQPFFGEAVFQQCSDCVVTVGVAPIVTISDYDPQLGLQVDAVQVVVHAVADELAVQRLGGEVVRAGVGYFNWS